MCLRMVGRRYITRLHLPRKKSSNYSWREKPTLSLLEGYVHNVNNAYALSKIKRVNEYNIYTF